MSASQEHETGGVMKLTRLASFFIGLLSIYGIASAQEPDRLIKLNVPAQALSDALNSLASQTGMRIVYYTRATEGLISPQIAGMYTAEGALKMLLSASPDLQYEFVDVRTVQIRNKGTNSTDATKSSDAPKPATSSASSGSSPIRLAQADPNATGDVGSADAVGPVPERRGIPEILVEGSRLLNTDIQRRRDDVQPYVVFDRKAIEKSGASNLEEFFKNRLPMNTASRTNSQAASSLNGSQSSINLRGLGSNQTLILIDGRRTAGSYAVGSGAGDINQSDINGIPLTAIERVEVLPSTASGIYGGGATGGVINIVLRRDYSGFEAGVTYENTFEANAAQRKVDLSAGFNLEGGKTHVLIAGSYSKDDPLLVGDREFARRSRELLFGNNPNALLGAATPPRGLTSNIRSVNGSNLILKTTQRLNSPITHVPAGYAGPTSDQGAALLANAGTYSLELPNDDDGARQSLLNSPTVASVSATVRRPFGSRVQGFLEVSGSDNQGEASIISPVCPTVVLQPNAPNNPFTTAIRVSCPNPALSGRRETEAETRRAVGGVIFKLSDSWVAEADYTWNRAESSAAFWVPFTAAGNSAFTSGALDVMRDVNAFPLTFSEAHLNPYHNIVSGPFPYVVKDATLRVSGHAIALPAGPLTVSTLIERREEELQASHMSAIQNGAETVTFLPDRSQTIDSAYLELRVPLIEQRWNIAGLHSLELQVAGRRDKYSTRAATNSVPTGQEASVQRVSSHAHSTDFTTGFRYSPIPDVILRASYGTGFLPASLSQLVPRTGTGTLTLVDPRRGGTSTTASFSQMLGGNPDLSPEESTSWSAGLILEPRILKNLRLSVDYTRIKKSNEIVVLTPQQLLDNETVLGDRITRGPKLPTDRPEWAGPVQGFDVSAVNLTRSEIEAYDVQLDYGHSFARWGRVEFLGLATWQTDFARQVAPSTATLNHVGFDGGPLKLRGTANVTWSRGPLLAGWTTQYYESYRVYSASASPEVISTSVLNQGSDEIPSQMYHDFIFSYRFGETVGFGGPTLENTEITLGIANVLNALPPIIATSGPAFGSYSSYADPRLRTYSISVRKSF